MHLQKYIEAPPSAALVDNRALRVVSFQICQLISDLDSGIRGSPGCGAEAASTSHVAQTHSDQQEHDQCHCGYPAKACHHDWEPSRVESVCLGASSLL